MGVYVCERVKNEKNEKNEKETESKREMGVTKERKPCIQSQVVASQ